MTRIFDLARVEPAPAAADRWTAVIPAAGRGTRLGADVPKALYPIAGRPLLDWLLDALEGVCKRTTLVLAPGADAVARHLRDRLGVAASVVVQPEPTGMADAILLAAEAVSTPDVLVLWGDQALVSARTLRACVCVHERVGAALTLPTVVRERPYITLVRDHGGRLVDVRQAREGEVDESTGESDCGVFLFSSAALFSALRAARATGAARGRATGEFNLLPLLPSFEQAPGGVATVRISDPDEALGVNTAADAAVVERRLRARLAGGAA